MYALDHLNTAYTKHISINLESYTILSDFLIVYYYLTHNKKVVTAALLLHYDYDVRCVVCVLNWNCCLGGTGHILKHMTHSNIFAC